MPFGKMIASMSVYQKIKIITLPEYTFDGSYEVKTESHAHVHTHLHVLDINAHQIMLIAAQTISFTLESEHES